MIVRLDARSRRVDGSIRGIEFGGFALTVLGSFLFYARWQRRTKPPAANFSRKAVGEQQKL